MIHTSIGLYPNGDFVVNGVTSENLASHIYYNLKHRPGRALIVDGWIISAGTVGVVTCVLFIGEHEIKTTEDTAPYK